MDPDRAVWHTDALNTNNTNDMNFDKLTIYGPSKVDIGNGDGPIELQEIAVGRNGAEPIPVGADFETLGYTFAERDARNEKDQH